VAQITWLAPSLVQLGAGVIGPVRIFHAPPGCSPELLDHHRGLAGVDGADQVPVERKAHEGFPTPVEVPQRGVTRDRYNEGKEGADGSGENSSPSLPKRDKGRAPKFSNPENEVQRVLGKSCQASK